MPNFLKTFTPRRERLMYLKRSS